jgi:hypothetical protein
MTAAARGSRELGHDAGRRDAADLSGVVFGEPEISVRPCRDALGFPEGGRNVELGHDAGGRDPPDLVCNVLGEPEISVGTRRDPRRAGR